jgi:CRISPR-associated exonuclease Cas4
MELPDYIPISMLNAFEYCPRRFWIEFVNAEMEVNAHVLEGQIKHERAHAAGIQQEGDEFTLRRVYVYSDHLRVTGFADLVEVSAGTLVPVEYKKGAMGKWLNDHIQLCAQAMCLEERLSSSPIVTWSLGQNLDEQATTRQPDDATTRLDHGFVFYFGSRRRERVEFDEALRGKTAETVERMWTLLREGQMPAPIDKFAKCRECSLEPICLPREVSQIVKRSSGQVVT